MARQEITDNHTPNQGQNIIDANFIELYEFVEALQEKVRVGGIAGVAPASDGGNITVAAGRNLYIATNNLLDTVTFGVEGVVTVVPTIADLRLATYSHLEGGEAAMVLGKTTVGDGYFNIYRWEEDAAVAFTALAADDTFTQTGHPYKTGDQVRFYGTGLPGNVLAGSVYFVIALTANTYKIADTYSDSAANVVRNITADGNGTSNWADDGMNVIVPSDNPSAGRWRSLVASGGKPSVTAGTRLGTTGSASLLPGSTDTAGTIQFTVDAAGRTVDGTYDDLLTFVPGRAYTRRKPIVMLTGANELASRESWSFVSDYDAATSTSWTIYSDHIQAAGVYRVNYRVEGN